MYKNILKHGQKSYKLDGYFPCSQVVIAFIFSFQIKIMKLTVLDYQNYEFLARLPGTSAPIFSLLITKMLYHFAQRKLLHFMHYMRFSRQMNSTEYKIQHKNEQIIRMSFVVHVKSYFKIKTATCSPRHTNLVDILVINIIITFLKLLLSFKQYRAIISFSIALMVTEQVIPNHQVLLPL